MQVTGDTNPTSSPVLAQHVASWITEDLVADTIATWQPYYARPLTPEDALAILTAVSNLVDTLESLP